MDVSFDLENVHDNVFIYELFIQNYVSALSKFAFWFVYAS